MNAGNVLQLVALLIVFVIVLMATYYVTKWIAKTGMIQSGARNIKVVETIKIAQNKYIQIIQIGSKYYSIGITKDSITYLSELDEDQLDLSVNTGQPGAQQIPFKELLDRFAKNKKK